MVGNKAGPLMGPVFVFVLFFRPNVEAGQGGETSHWAIRIVKMFHGKHFGSVGHTRQSVMRRHSHNPVVIIIVFALHEGSVDWLPVWTDQASLRVISAWFPDIA